MDCLKRVVSSQLTVLSEPMVICSNILKDKDYREADTGSTPRSAALNGLFSALNQETNIKVFSECTSGKSKDKLKDRINGYYFQCSFCKRWRNTWQALRTHFSDMHWHFRDFR